MARAGGSRLFTVYVVASLVPFVVLGLLVNRMVGHDIDDRALAEAVARAKTIADGSIEPALDGRDLGWGIADYERSRLVRATQGLQGDAQVLLLRLRSTTGTIVFDAEHPNDPPEQVVDDEVRLAATGLELRSVTRVGADSVDGGSDSGAPAVETYVAIHGPDGSVIGVLETYLPYAPFESAAAASKQRLARALALGLVAIWCVLALVTLSVTRRLRRSAADNDWLARHDRLTGLPNRTAFAERVEEGWRTEAGLLVAVADVDRFREVNDTLGQRNGDELLVQLAARLRDRLAPRAEVARLGGDQFGILVADDRPEAEVALLDSLTGIAQESFDVGGVVVQAELSVGLASRVDPVDDAAGVLRAAELALHEAKEVGVATLHYSPSFDHFDPDRLALAAELANAITGGELVLHYQPKVDLASGDVRSVEALVRWEHPRRGIVPPGEFIPIAESTRLIEPLTAWVVEQACRDLASWRGTRPDLCVSVNLSARSLDDPDLPDRLLAALADAAVPASRLEVEITETAILADPGIARKLLRRLHESGVRVSLDDFGQGATSLASLAGLPLDEIKVDRAFVVGMDRSEEQRAVVEFVIALGHRLGLSVVAEGIETDDAAAMLAGMGCDEGQGYLYSRPVPAHQLERWLDRQEQLRPSQPERWAPTSTTTIWQGSVPRFRQA